MAYLRVSTDEQRLGPEAQRAQIESWAAHEGVQIVDWKEERGVSGGAELVDRAALLEAVEALREHKAGVLIVAKRDRMARDIGKAREIAGEDGLVQSAGAVVRSADGMSGMAGPGGVFMEGMQDLFAEYERELIRTRTKAALGAKQARDEMTGQAPFGYRAGPGGLLEQDPGEVAIIRVIATLKRADATERGIAEELARRGFRSRKGTPLSQTQVHRIIARIDWLPGGGFSLRKR